MTDPEPSTRPIRVQVRGYTRAAFDLTQSARISAGETYRPEPGIAVTAQGSLERKGVDFESVSLFLVQVAAGHALVEGARYLCRRLLGKVEVIEIDGMEVALEEAEVLEAMRQAAGHNVDTDPPKGSETDRKPQEP